MIMQEFARRRKRLMDFVNAGSVVVLPSAPERIRNRDIYYPYRQDSDLYYLTGFREPESVAVLVPDRPQGEFILFCREHDHDKEIWHGRRAGLEGACDEYGADDAFPIGDMDDIIPGLLEDRTRIFYTMGSDLVFDTRVIGWVNQIRARGRTGVSAPKEFVADRYFPCNVRCKNSPLRLLWAGRREHDRRRK